MPVVAPSPLDVSPWIARIAANCPAVKFAGRAAEHLAAINQGPAITPSAYVLEPSYTPIGVPNYSGGISGGYSQMLLFKVGVLTCTFNLADATGSAAGSDAFAARQQVFATLCGYQPGGGGDFTVTAGSGQMVSYKDGFLYYLDSFLLQFNMRNF